MPETLNHRMIEVDPIRMKYGCCPDHGFDRHSLFEAIAAVLVEVEPGGMRELHWHPNADEWQYYLRAKRGMTAFASANSVQTFDYQAGDVGSIPPGDAPLCRKHQVRPR